MEETGRNWKKLENTGNKSCGTTVLVSSGLKNNKQGVVLSTCTVFINKL